MSRSKIGIGLARLRGPMVKAGDLVVIGGRRALVRRVGGRRILVEYYYSTTESQLVMFRYAVSDKPWWVY